MIYAAIVRQILGDNRRFADVALPRHQASLRGGDRDVAYVARRFRDALETLGSSKRAPSD
jgi:hypothetical protein